MNSTVLDKVKPSFSFLFEDYGFYVVEAYDSPSFGDSIAILASDDLRIRFVRDRGQIFIDIGSASKPDNWYDLDLVKAIIGGNRGEDVAALEDPAVFLKNNYTAVKNLFVDEKFDETEKALKELQQFRAQKMFPQLFKTRP